MDDNSQMEAGRTAPPGWYSLEGQTRWWDGTVWADSPPVARPEGFFPVHGLGRAVQAAVGLTCLVTIAATHALFGRLGLLDRLDRGVDAVTSGEIDRSDRYVFAMENVQIGLLFVTGVMFLVWLWRVYRNLHGSLGARRLDISAGWAVGWWFVPIANLFKPLGIMSEAWAASRPGYPRNSDLWTHERRSPLLGLWWAALICSGIVTRIGGSDPDPTAIDTAGLRFNAWMNVGGNVLFIIAGALLVVIVGQVSDRHGKRHGELQHSP